MITLTYTLLALAPMVLGLCALLAGWALGWAMASPLPRYDAYEAYSEAERVLASWYRVPPLCMVLVACVMTHGTSVARAVVHEPCRDEHGLFGVPSSGVPPPQVRGIIGEVEVQKGGTTRCVTYISLPPPTVTYVKSVSGQKFKI